jgi:BolA protein
VSDVVRAIRGRLAALDPELVDLTDDSALHAGHEGAKSGGGHYRLTIVSPRFRGATTVARHRLVYDALAPMMKREIHALAIRAFTPEETSSAQPISSKKEPA